MILTAPTLNKELSLFDRARRYIQAVPAAISGQGGHNQTFAVACALVHGFALDESDAYQLLAEYNQGCQPAWTERELFHKIKEAGRVSHSKARGHLVGESSWSDKSFSYYKQPASASPTKTQIKKYDPHNRTPLPEALEDATRRFLMAAFESGEFISMVDAVENPKDQRSTPEGGGTVLCREEWIERLNKFNGDPNKIFTNQKCGAFIRINPMQPDGKADAHVTVFRHALVEFDQLSVEDQYSIIVQSGLPCAAVLHSGGKSIHAWVKVNAKDRAEYDQRVQWLYEHFRQYGIDPKNRNPSRFSRLPGMKRGGTVQKLLAINAGADDWLAWQTQKENESLGELVNIFDAFNFDPTKDPNSVLGRRWLCRGGSCILVGQSGIGKSSLSVQAAIRWACGFDFFGVKPTVEGKQLKSLIIQAENDKGDVSEMLKGVVGGFAEEYKADDTSELQRIISENIIIVRNQAHTGKDFCDTLRRLIGIHRPDLVWVDPLLAFFGDDISNQKACSQFLRNWINPILDSSGVVLFMCHHTNKPERDGKAKAHWTRNDYSYAGSGSSELTNWARAVVVLRQHDDDTFRLSFTKRGGRAGSKDKIGDFSRDVWLTHAQQKIYWVQVDEPEEQQTTSGPKAKSITFEIVKKAVKGEMLKVDIERAIGKVIGRSEDTIKRRWDEVEPFLDRLTLNFQTMWRVKEI